MSQKKIILDEVLRVLQNPEKNNDPWKVVQDNGKFLRSLDDQELAKQIMEKHYQYLGLAFPLSVLTKANDTIVSLDIDAQSVYADVVTRKMCQSAEWCREQYNGMVSCDFGFLPAPQATAIGNLAYMALHAADSRQGLLVMHEQIMKKYKSTGRFGPIGYIIIVWGIVVLATVGRRLGLF